MSGQTNPVISRAIKTAATFVTRHAFGHHRIDHGVVSYCMKGIVCRQYVDKRTYNVSHQVNPDQIVEAKHASLGNTHRPPHQSVGSLYRHASATRLIDTHLQRKYTHSVTEESWRVSTSHYALAQLTITKIGQPIDHGGVSLGPGDQFQQTHVAHRVKKVRDRKTFAQGVGHALCQQRNRNR